MFRILWSYCCSLKLAIVLASVATLTAIGGSLLVPSRTAVFGSMDRMLFGRWLSEIGVSNFSSTWWVFLTALLVVLLGINTLCCFVDWVLQLRSRWRKSGEYMIHLGFVLVVAALAIGSVSGFRSTGHQLKVGETMAVPHRDGLYLRLDSFEPRFGPDGGFRDMVNELTLLKADREIARETVRINHPMQAEGLLVLASSFGREPVGFRFAGGNGREYVLKKSATVDVGDERRLKVLRFYPDAAPDRQGNAVPRRSEIGNPAFELSLRQGRRSIWQGWYFLRRGVPAPLRQAGIRLRPLAPVFEPYSVLSINRDPGAPLALTGCISMALGVVFAFFSYYAKRRRKDRPQVD